MNRLQKFLSPLIITLYTALGSSTGFAPNLMRPLSLGAIIIVGYALYIKKRSAGISAIDWSFFLYLLFNVVSFWGFPGALASIIVFSPTGLLYAILFFAAALPSAIAGYNFTEFFARKTTPSAVWSTDVFKTINRNMTRAWAAIFALSTIITLLPKFLSLPVDRLWTILLFQVVLPAIPMLAVGVPMNRKYPAYYQRKVGIEPVTLSSQIPGGGMPDNDSTAGIPVSHVEKPSKEDNMSDKLTIVAINGSPHGAIGNTSIMVAMIANALSTEGIRVEEIFLSDRRVEYCLGCGVCIEKRKCWRQDDHAEIVDKIMAADGIILASPVYFKHVTAQMKTFIDRSLSLGHRPRTSWKPGLAISVSAGMAETATAHYLGGLLRAYGAYPVGTLTAIATNPGAFLGKELVEARARDLAGDLARAIKEKRRYPATDEDLFFYLFMRELVTREKEFMQGDYRHWQESGLLDSFEAYVKQNFSPHATNPEMRQAWIRQLVKEENMNDASKAKERAVNPSRAGAVSAATCLKLLKMMPLAFKADAAPGLSAVYQFEISGTEEFTCHLAIADNVCRFHEGAHLKPDVTVKSPASVWLAVSKGEVDGQAAFMSGKYRVEGNLALLLKLRTLFG